MKPTVLIGLGGLGSQTVDSIYRMMDSEQKKNTATAVLDTDVGDLQALESIEVKIQTSPDVKVGNYVYNHPEIMEWFPYEYAKINDMMLSDGAGQVRALSRLSFYSALERGAIYALDSAIEKLALLSDSQYTSDVNVVVVGSIAGGTCSGSFIQMGMYMRQYFLEKNPNASIFIQGVFLLPDTITKTGAIVQSEWKNTRFNAYAALKELNAILSPSVVKKVNIELEYKPNVDSIITYGNRPYDNILFFDYENSRNQHLVSLNEYKLLLAETVYYAYLSPISASYQSRFVNQIREFIRNNQESFYSASSVNKLIYPYDDIVKYLSLEWIISEIDREWLQFDKQYQVEIKEYKIDLQKGVNRPKPQMNVIYMDNLDRLERVTEKSAFYTIVFNQTRLINDETRDILERKDRVFMEAIEEFISNSLSDDNDFIKYKKRCEIQPMRLEDIDNAKGHIAELEIYLKRLEKNIDTVVHKHQNILLKNILTQHCGMDNMKTENRYNINFWLLPEKDAMHPVAIRYFLYRIQDSLVKKIAKLDEEIKKTKKFVEGYYKKYDIPTSRDTEDETYYETSVEVITMISGQTVIEKMKNFAINNKSLQFKPFIEVFNEHYNKQVSQVSKLIEFKLQHGVMEKLLTRLNKMIENWADLFDMLSKDLMEDMERSRNDLLHKHEGGKKDIFVFESSKNKKLLWEELEASLIGNADNATLSTEIAKAQYQLFCKQISPERRYDDDKSTKQLYSQLLIDAYSSALKEKEDKQLNINIKEAIELESRLIGEREISLDGYIKKLTNKNLPWMHTAAEKLVLTKFWGANDKDLFAGVNLEGNDIIDRSFPKNEVVYLVMYHNLSITDFAKFAARGTFSKTRIGQEESSKVSDEERSMLLLSNINGAYFQAYHELMDSIAKYPEQYVTPHIDKRWNSPIYIPDLNASVADQASTDISYAFIYGIIEKNLYKAMRDKVDYFYAKNGTKSEIIKKDAKPLKATKWLDLYRELSNNPIIVGNLTRMHESLKEQSIEQSPWIIEEDSFVKLLNNGKTLEILVEMLTYESRDDETYEMTLDIIGDFGEIISSYIQEGYGERQITSASDAIEELKDKLIERLNKTIDNSVIEDVKSSLRR